MAKATPSKPRTPEQPAAAWTPTSTREPWKLSVAIAAKAASDSPDEDSLASMCAAEGLGGRPVAQLLIAAVRAHKHYAAIAATEERVQAELRELSDHVSGPLPLGQAGDDARLAWGRAATAAAEVDQAIGYVAYLHQQFPALFNRQPELLHGKPCVLGDCPPELQGWFEAYELNPKQFASWTTIGRQAAPPAPKRRIVSM
ncbi:MAG: hypothetical protein ACOX1P_18350 [Thermoguttaceae bacterium]|jgi:hypothetical protein